MAWQYSEKTKELFMMAVSGQQGSHLGEIEDPDGLGEHGSVACGDAMRFTFEVEKHPTDPIKDKIIKARYLTYGCTSAIASSEALCILIEEKKLTPLEAMDITNQDIVKYLDGLPKQKIHCSVMGAEALEAAIFNWSQKRGIDLKKWGVNLLDRENEEGKIICQCFSISEPYVREKIKELNLKSIEDVTNAIKAGGACKSCHHKPGGLQDILDEELGVKKMNQKKKEEEKKEDGQEDGNLSSFQFGKKVEQVLAEEVRPYLQRDGGNIELVDIKDHIVYCRLQGACRGCPGAQQTLKNMVENTLQEKVDPRIKVISV